LHPHQRPPEPEKKGNSIMGVCGGRAQAGWQERSFCLEPIAVFKDTGRNTPEEGDNGSASRVSVVERGGNPM